MGVPFDYAADRPEYIETILNGLDRYNPETTGTFQDYVASQCETQTYDCFANLALLKLYVPPQSPSSIQEEREKNWDTKMNTIPQRFLLPESKHHVVQFISSI